MKRLLLVALFLPLLGCGGDATGPRQASVSGTWRFSYNSMAGTVQGVTVTCNVSALDFNLTQSGNTFSGIQVGTGNMSCSAPGVTPFSYSVVGETIVNGQITGSSISFRLGSVTGQNTAAVAGTSMSGTAQWVIPVDNAALTLNGQFTAAKM